MGEHLNRLKAALEGRYTIIREVGSGGMATVYLAEDERHRRKVALKVLRPEIAASLGSDRFFREIEVAARLQHPHILPLLDSGQGEGFYYYAMPYIAGESLRDRLTREGELPVHDAVKILIEVVDALAAAHKEGVVHRDIKPDNVMISGRHALVTDFGVAKAVSEATGRQQLTTAGIALGTPAYMAPEQAAADPHLDHRVDIYAVGIMGYEMLSGHPPFQGRSPQEILAAHVTQHPEPVTTRRQAVPATLGAVIMRCLEKRPADRWQTAEELLSQLEILATPSGGMTPTQTRPIAAVSRTRGVPRWFAWAGAGALVAAGALAISLNQRQPETIKLGRRIAVAASSQWELWPSLSPDGRTVTYSSKGPGRCETMVQQVDGGAPLSVTESLAGWQCFGALSPDGSRLLYIAGDGAYIMPTLGGQPRRVVAGNPLANEIVWGTWSPDGKSIALVGRDTLFTQSLDSPARTTITTGPEIHSPAWSPDGEWIAYVEGNLVYHVNANIAPSQIRIVRTSGGPSIALTDAGTLNTSPIWIPGRHALLFISDREGGRDIYQLFLDNSGQPDGAPIRITTGLNPERIGLSGDGKRLTWSVFTETANVWSIPIPTRDSVPLSQAQRITSGTETTENIDVSADGRWLYYDSDRTGNADLWRLSLPGGVPEQLTTDPTPEFSPNISPDGREIVFHRFRDGNRDIFVIPVGGGPESQISTRTGDDRGPRWSSSGRWVAWADLFLPRNGMWVAERKTDGSWGTPRNLALPEITGDYSWFPAHDSILVSTVEGMVITDPAKEGYRVVGPEVNSTYIEWSADQRLLFGISQDPAGRLVIEELTLATAKRRVLVYADNPLLQEWRFGFSMAQGRFYFPLIDRKADIWVAEIETP